MTSISTSDNHGPAREVWVAQALIKARVAGKAEPLYLVQRDEELTDEYRLIGGRFEPSDGDLLETMKREMLEELGLEYVKDYTLNELIHELPVSARLSPTYGVLSSYRYRLYKAEMIRKIQLKVGDNRWVTKRELLAGRMDSGEKIAAWHAKAIDDQLPGGLDGVALSFPEELSRGSTVQ
jgi:8-oxo-dGTP pyrophosphatase MutT (NUDIX family)